MDKTTHVATLTFHEAYNNGAVLQAYALQEALGLLGCEAEILNYACPAIRGAYGKPQGLKQRIGWIFRAKDFEGRKEKFDRFRSDFLKLSEQTDRRGVEAATARYDAIIVGSDQVWNPRITESDPTYFLDFIQDSSRKKSYAASIGTETWPQACEEELARRVSQFSSVLVRERTAASYLEGLVDCSVGTVCDPVFLLDRERWEEVAISPSIGEPYVLVVPLGRPEADCLKWAQEVAARRDCKIVVLHASAFNAVGALNVKDAGPREYLGLIAQADMVITNSFHASCFSLIFGRQYCWFRSDAVASDLASRESRLHDLLADFGLEKCMVTSGDRHVPEIDGDAVSRTILQIKDESLRALGASLADRVADGAPRVEE